MRCTWRLENRARAEGRQRIAGADEVGRGSLFGPVVAAAVILDPARRIRGLNDSKQLDAERRRQLDAQVRASAVSFAVAAVDAARIDQLNIYHASRLAMRRAVLALRPRPDLVLVDALKLDLPWDVEQRAIIHGDALSVSIAAASIIAKVYRDALLCEWDAVYPEYQLASNKGYLTPQHMAAIERCGITPLHRRNYAPVSAAALFPPPADAVLETLPLFPSQFPDEE